MSGDPPYRSTQELRVELPDGWTPEQIRGPHVGLLASSTPGALVVRADAEGRAWLSAQGIAAHTLPGPPPELPPAYTTPAAAVAKMDAWCSANPRWAKRVDLGYSVEGRPIVALRIGDDDARIHVRVHGAHHGDEPISAEVVLHLAEALLSAAEGDATTAQFLETHAVWLIPHVNPDGIDAMQRDNAHDVDLNRNYGYFWSEDEFHAGPYPFSEPETRAMQALAVRAPATWSIAVHAGATNIGWPWNYTVAPPDDAPQFQDTAQDYVHIVDDASFYGLQGASWYTTQGDSNDWLYGVWGAFEWTVEVSTSKAPADPAPYLAAHVPALMAFLHSAPAEAIQLVDAASGHALQGTLQPADVGRATWSAIDGTTARPAGPASAFVAAAPGYSPTEVPLPIARETAALRRLAPRAHWQVWPPIVRIGETATLTLDPPLDGELWISTPDGARFVTTAVDGVLRWNTQGEAPGRWWVGTEEIPDAAVLWVEGQDVPDIRSLWWDGQSLTVQIDPPGDGIEAWFFADGVPVSTHNWAVTTDDGIRWTPPPLPPAQKIDVLLWGPGGPIAIHDLTGLPWHLGPEISGTNERDTGLPEASDAASTCGCQGPSTDPWLGAILLYPLFRRHFA